MALKKWATPPDSPISVVFSSYAFVFARPSAQNFHGFPLTTSVTSATSIKSLLILHQPCGASWVEAVQAYLTNSKNNTIATAPPWLTKRTSSRATKFSSHHRHSTSSPVSRWTTPCYSNCRIRIGAR